MKAITLQFRGETYTVPAEKSFALGAEVEEVVTFTEMASWGRNPRFFKIAQAFGIMLRFAGAKVSDAEVKAEIDASILKAQADGASPDLVKELFAMQAVEQLQAVLFDGAPAGEGGDAPGKTTAS